MEKLLRKKILAVILTLLVCGCSSNTKGAATLVNESGSIIKSAGVRVSDQSFSFDNIEPGGSREFFFDISGDSDFEVKAVFDSDRILSKKVGYVTSGIDQHDVIHIKESDITLDTESRKFH